MPCPKSFCISALKMCILKIVQHLTLSGRCDTLIKNHIKILHQSWKNSQGFGSELGELGGQMYWNHQIAIIQRSFTPIYLYPICPQILWQFWANPVIVGWYKSVKYCLQVLRITFSYLTRNLANGIRFNSSSTHSSY